MTRKPRNYLPHLTAEYARQHPDRPAKYDFSDELLAAVAFVMRQVDPDGKRPVIEPAVYAEGAEPGPTARGGSRPRRIEP
ncbi:MAG TPA: hypothetical protein VH092_22995 [Urbifossiella sp.]|nr:hypothetical protein [Urbifossiella sp.]